MPHRVCWSLCWTAVPKELILHFVFKTKYYLKIAFVESKKSSLYRYYPFYVTNNVPEFSDQQSNSMASFSCCRWLYSQPVILFISIHSIIPSFRHTIMSIPRLLSISYSHWLSVYSKPESCDLSLWSGDDSSS